MTHLLGLALVLAAACFLSSAAARAADELQVLQLRAEQLAAAGDCRGALRVLDVARAEAPRDPPLARLAGLCANQLGRYDEALEPLGVAYAADPEAPGVALALGVARFQQGDLAGAEEALRAAERVDPDNAELLFYQGLLAFEADRHREAAELLERAVAIDPAFSEPRGSYYAGLAWERAEERERARRSLERALAHAPRSLEAQRAQQLLEQLDDAARLRRWVRVEAGMEWDSNAVLRGQDVVLPEGISGDSDWRGIWRLDGQQEVFRNEDWAAGLTAGHLGYAYTDLNEFNLYYLTTSTWLDRRIDEETFVRLQPEFGYGWRDNDAYVSTYGITSSLYRDWGEPGSGRFFVHFDQANYRFDVLGVTPEERSDRNRDGRRWITGYDHFYAASPTIDLRGGVAFESYNARGREYTFLGGGPWLGARWETPWQRLAIETFGSFQYRGYQHPSTYPDPGQTQLSNSDRKEHTWRTELAVERPILDSLLASVRWRYTDNSSNTDVYEYDRHIIGAYLTFVWAQ